MGYTETAMNGIVSANSTMPACPLYGDHIVAFVDILGFSELVQKLDATPELIDQIYVTLTKLDTYQVAGGFADYSDNEAVNITIASDSIMLSLSLDRWRAQGRSDAWACVAVLESIFWLQRYLLARGVLTRGGITVGRLLHTSNAVFGPGLVDAYRLESQIAIFPRVVIADTVLALSNNVGSALEEMLTIRRDFVTQRDTDGINFVDYLHVNAMGVENEKAIVDLFQRIASAITDAARASRYDLRIYQKVAWLANYFNRALARLIDLGYDRVALVRRAPV